MRFSALLLLACLAAPLAAQPLLRLHGSTTVKAALEPRKAELEAKAGVRVEFQAFGSGSGLLALASGAADVAMISAPLPELAQRLNAKKPGSIDTADLQPVQIGAVRLTFIVNPRNAVRHLSAAQLAQVLTGKVRNWSEVGGPHQPIVVVSLANAGPLVEEKLLRGQKITDEARRVPVTTQIPAIVAQELGAIGIVSASHARGKTSVITTDADVSTPLLLVTRGAATPAAAKLIEAARAVLAEKGS